MNKMFAVVLVLLACGCRNIQMSTSLKLAVETDVTAPNDVLSKPVKIRIEYEIKGTEPTPPAPPTKKAT